MGVMLDTLHDSRAQGGLLLASVSWESPVPGDVPYFSDVVGAVSYMMKVGSKRRGEVDMFFACQCYVKIEIHAGHLLLL